MLERILRLVVGIVLVVVLVCRRALGDPPRRLRLARSRSRSESVTPVRAGHPVRAARPTRACTTRTTRPRSSASTWRRSSTTSRSAAPSARGSTPANVLALNQEEVDQLYGRLTAGPIPDGPYLGDLFFSRGETLKPRLEEILGGLEGRVAAEKIETRRGRRPRALEGQDVLPRQAASSGTSSRTSTRSQALDRRSRRARAGDRAARGLAASTSCPPPTSGCSSRPSSTAARACSTAAASR